MCPRRTASGGWEGVALSVLVLSEVGLTLSLNPYDIPSIFVPMFVTEQNSTSLDAASGFFRGRRSLLTEGCF